MSNISITRALAEIKALEDRIGKAIAEGVFVAVTKGRGERRTVMNSAISVDTMTANVTASHQKVDDLIKRRQLLKKLVIESNGMTYIKVCDVSMTVAEAIERKNSIKFERAFFDQMRTQWLRADSQVVAANTKLGEDIERAVTAAYASDKSKPTPEMFDAIAEPRRREHEAALLDPASIRAKLEALANDLNSFNAEIDFVLSESNARTEIVVPD